MVQHDLVAHRGDRDRPSRRAHPRTDPGAVDARDHRRAVRVIAIRRVVAFRERGDRHHRSIQVGRVRRHERPLVAERAVGRVEPRVGDHRRRRRLRGHAPQRESRRGRGGRRGAHRRHDRARVVHAGEQHARRVPGRVRRIDLPGRERQPVVTAPLVGHRAADLDPVEVLDRHRQVGHRELLAESGRGRVEFGREVVQDEPGVMGRGRRLGPDEEVGLRLHLVVQDHLPAVAQPAQGSGERGHFPRLRRDAHVVGHGAQCSGAGRRHHDVAPRPEAPEAGAAHVGGRIGVVAGRRAVRVVRVAAAGGRPGIRRIRIGRTEPAVGRVDGCLVGHDEDVGQAAEL